MWKDEPVRIAHLRQTFLAIASGVAAEYADEEAEVVIRIEGEARSRRSQRIGRATIRQIDAGD